MGNEPTSTAVEPATTSPKPPEPHKEKPVWKRTKVLVGVATVVLEGLALFLGEKFTPEFKTYSTHVFVVGIAILGVFQRVDQQVSDPGHRRDNHGDGPLVPLVGDDLRGGPNAIGRSHAGTAEFHYD